MAEQAGGGTGEQVLESGSRRPAIPGLVLVRRLRTRLAPSHSGGVGAPPGGTTASCQELADDRWAHFAPPAKARPDAGRRTPQQSAERRAGPRHGPVISGDPEIGPLARRATGCGVSAPAPVGALLPSIFRERKQAKGHPPPLSNGPAELCPSSRHSGAERSEEPGIHNHGTGEWNTDRPTKTGWWLWIPGPALPRRPGMTARVRVNRPAASTTA